VAGEDTVTDAPLEAAGRGVAVNTAIFSALTGLSRVAGLGREIVASSYFATSGAFSAFTIAFQLPNLLRMLVADQAISAAFVPVFTELLQEGRRKEALRLASSLFFVILAGLGALTAAFVLAAPLLMPLLTGDEFTEPLDVLTVGLSQLLFPTVVLLGLNGLTLGILYAYDDFTIGGIAPLVWNVVILAILVPLHTAFEGPDQLYAYAIAVLAGTVAQFAITLPRLRQLGFRLEFSIDLKDERVRRVMRLMLPVAFTTGLVNFSLLINSAVGSFVDEQAPRAIDAGFRIYQLPQGVFALALATVLFPTLSRLAARADVPRLRASAANGVRQLALLLIPAAALTIALAEPVTRLVYERGAFGPESTERVSEALFWFSFSLPLNGINLLLTRTFFSFQRAWVPTALAVANVAANLAISIALAGAFGIAGVVAGTLAGNVVMAAGQWWFLRRRLEGFEGARTALAVAQILGAAALAALAAHGAWDLVDGALGRSLAGQVASVGAAGAAGTAIYGAIVAALRIPEGRQLWNLLAGRVRGA
jgi:putative peptidoglycan lipid II flippase